jgi:hypothetical protein
MRSGELVAALLVVLAAVAVTTHLALVYGLVYKRPRWRALAALVVPPLAPWWGWREHRKRSILWILAVVGYFVVRAVAAR